MQALEAEAAALREELAGLTASDPARFQTKEIVPGATNLDVFYVELLWVN